uniref:Uncharacterized protein n=1 Tax=Anguilla anguilla TaxID=7936 RepID=A0A0E9PL15_ANGAN
MTPVVTNPIGTVVILLLYSFFTEQFSHKQVRKHLAAK